MSMALNLLMRSSGPRPTGCAEDLGTLSGRDFSFARAVNDGDQVVGISVPNNRDPHAFLWSERTGMIDLGSFPGR